MRVIFMGTAEFALPTLCRLHGATEILAVVTQPDRPSGRGNRLTPPPVKSRAAELGLTVLQPEKARGKPFVRSLRELGADVIVVVAYGQLLPKSILELTPYGCVNVHPSLLPKYRGAAPIPWAIWNGETVTGVSIMRLDEGEDSGPVYRQAKVAIGADETAPELSARLAELGAAMLLETIQSFDSNPPTPTPQDDSAATRAPRLERSMGQVDWHLPAAVLYNHYRACVPWPGTFTFLPDGRKLQILDCRPIEAKPETTPGAIHVENSRLFVDTGRGRLELIRVQPENRPSLSIRDFLNGLRGDIPAGLVRLELEK